MQLQNHESIWTNILYLHQRLAMPKRTPKQTGDEPQQKITVADALGELEKRILHRASSIARKRKHRMTIIADLPKILRTDLKNFCDPVKIGFLQIVLP